MTARWIGRLGASLASTIALLTLTGTPAEGAPARPDLVVVSLVVGSHTAKAGRSLLVTDVVRNRGSAAASRSTTGYYLSRVRARGSGLRLGLRAIGSLQPHTSSRGSARVRIPTAAAAGSYWVIACADDHHRIRESEELNNCRASAHAVTLAAAGGDRTPPTFAGLKSAFTCIPGPIGGKRTSSYTLRWRAATDADTPSAEIAYDVYQATAPLGEDFSKPTYTARAGVTTFSTPALPATKEFYFVVRARDPAGNRDHNRIERRGVNRCE